MRALFSFSLRWRQDQAHPQVLFLHIGQGKGLSLNNTQLGYIYGTNWERSLLALSNARSGHNKRSFYGAATVRRTVLGLKSLVYEVADEGRKEQRLSRVPEQSHGIFLA